VLLTIKGMMTSVTCSFVLALWLLGWARPMAMAQSSGTFTSTGNMTVARSSHTATLLSNGKVLIAGGTAILPERPVWASAELYDPFLGTFSPAGNMTVSRSGHTATLLPDGKVLIVGGRVAFGNGAWGETAQSSAELYDPLSGTFTRTGSMRTPRESHTATLLNNGKVLIAGGVDFSSTTSAQTFLGSAELYDPSTGTFAATGSMKAARTALTATLLPSGKVLLGSYFNYNSQNNDDLERAELYDSESGTFSLTGQTTYPELRASSASLLTNGDVLETLEYSCDPADVAEVYHPSTETFTRIGKMSGNRGYNTTTLLPEGTVLVAGQDFSRAPVYASAELYDPSTGSFSPGSVIPTKSQQGHTATLLPDGRVLLAGGWICCGSTIATAEIYHPAVLKGSPVLLSVTDKGQGAILHASTHRLVSPDNPAVVGEALEIYGTGLIDGSVIPPQVAIGGRLAEVLFFGGAPGYPGLKQINVSVPSGVPLGPTVSVRLNYLTRPSNEVTLAVQ
jgi:hypothetical protein